MASTPSSEMTVPVAEFVRVSGEPTYVLKQGEIRQKEDNVLILIIPGNPGVADYYDLFMQTLHRAIDEEAPHTPIWCVSHAGHVSPPSHIKSTSTEDFLSLQGQVRHKVCFINEYVPPDTKLILVGHSIGCYMILRMLKHLQPSRVLKCLLLFPTIERLALSEKGRMSGVVKHIHWMAPWLMYGPSYLVPASMKFSLIKWYFKGKNVPDTAIQATTKLADATVIGNVASMGNEELQTVVEADYDIIDEHIGKLMFYYGANDHWCPVEFYHDMKGRYPKADIYLCKEGLEHAFVLESGEEMARWVWQWLKENVAHMSHPGKEQ